MKKIYLADDDDCIRNLLKLFLETQGYEVDEFDTGDKLLEKFIRSPSDFVILNVFMPGTDGLTICSEIRSASEVPIILLSESNLDSDIISGITLGADDYLVKPFSPALLGIKVKAILRRTDINNRSDNKNSCIIAGDLEYSRRKHCISVNNKKIDFTETEMTCLLYLVEHFDNAVSRSELLNNVWGYNVAQGTRVTDETIRKIRKKLCEAGSRSETK